MRGVPSNNCNALDLYLAPLWNPSHWRVELRCLHIRKHAQGDPTTVRNSAKLRAIENLQLLYVVTERACQPLHHSSYNAQTLRIT